MEKIVIISGTRAYHNEDSVNELLKQGWTVKSVTANPGCCSGGGDSHYSFDGTYLIVLQK